jgi:hypothetical protein
MGSRDGADAVFFVVTTETRPGEKGDEPEDPEDPGPPIDGVELFVILSAASDFVSPSFRRSSTANRRSRRSAIALKPGSSFHVSPETHRKRRSRSARSTVSYGPDEPWLCRDAHCSCTPSKRENKSRTSSDDAPLVVALTRIASLNDRRGTFRSPESVLALRNRSVKRPLATARFSSGVSASSPWVGNEGGKTREGQSSRVLKSREAGRPRVERGERVVHME